MRTGIISLCLLCLVTMAKAQLISGNAFLKGNFVEVGMAPYGCWGTTIDAPAGYHARSNMNGDGPAFGKLGFVADPEKDGWNTGTTQNYFGDYFLAANPFTGWGLSVGGFAHYFAERINNGLPPGGGYGGIPAGVMISVTPLPGAMQCVWETTVDVIRVRKIVTVPVNSAYFTVRTVLTNTAATPSQPLFYAEYVNPDPDAGYLDQRYESTTTFTRNTVVFNNPADGKALIKAVGSQTGAYLGLGSKDCRAHVGRAIDVSFQQPVNASYMYAGGPDFRLTGTDMGNGNGYIGISFNIGSLQPGDSTSCTFAYILAEADLDAALDETDPTFDYAGTSYPTGGTIKICPGSTIPVNLANAENLAWTWTPTTGIVGPNTGVNVQLQATATPVTYTASGTTLCGVKTASITISPELPDPPIVADANYCQYAAATPLTATGANLLWYTAATGGLGDATAPLPSTTTVGSTTWYVSQGPDAACPSNRVPLIVNVRPVTNSTDDRTICTSQLPYTWNGINVTATGNAVATYTAMNQYGCDSIVTLNLQTTAAVTPAISITRPDKSICDGDAVTFTATPVNAGTAPVYQWMKNGIAVGTNSITYTDASLNNNDRITCTLTTSGGCVTTPVVTSLADTVQVEPSITATITKSNDLDCSTGQTTLTATGADNYSWTPVTGLANPNLPQTIARPSTTTTYQVAASSAGGCTDTAEITVTVTGIKNDLPIPNAFSPNNDGKNDCFGLPVRSALLIGELSIYNRWGERVFFTNDLSQCWNGTYKGSRAPEGVYLYYIKAKSDCGDLLLKGNVVLIR